MLGKMIKKEIATTMLDFRFVIASLLFLVLIPLGMYVSREDYEQRLANYSLEHQMYRQKYGTEVSSKVEVQGLRPPSVLSIFASGLEPYLPDKVITSRSGIFNTAKDVRAGDSPSLLFGRMDLLFNICYVVSLVALAFTFSSVSGERQEGTLGLILANSVSRSHILLSKIIGNYICLLIPFIMSLLVASIILELSQDISILWPQLYPAYLAILVVTLAFILTMVTLGVLISGMTQKPITSMTVSLFVWVILVLAIPKISPMLARIIYPAEGEQVVNFRKRVILDDLQETHRQKSTEIHDKYQHLPEKSVLDYFAVKGFYNRKAIPLPPDLAGVAPLDAELTALNKETQAQINNLIGQIEQDHRNKMNIQNAIAMYISRISPVSCFAYLVSGLSNTGTREYDKFRENAQTFQDEVKKVVYDNYERRVWKSGSQTTTLDDPPDSVPDMHYRYANMAEILEAGSVDVFLSFGFTFLFFTLAFAVFNRYDVRP